MYKISGAKPKKKDEFFPSNPNPNKEEKSKRLFVNERYLTTKADDQAPKKEIKNGRFLVNERYLTTKDDDEDEASETDSLQPLIERSHNAFYNLLPQLTNSVFGSFRDPVTQPPVIKEQPTKKATESLVGNHSQDGSGSESEDEEENDQFQRLVDWQKASIVSTSVSENGIVLTDDGRTMTQEEARPKCPICDEIFEVGEVKALEHHVDSHLVTSLFCPVCSQAFSVANRSTYQKHVQVRKMILLTRIF